MYESQRYQALANDDHSEALFDDVVFGGFHLYIAISIEQQTNQVQIQ